MVRGIFTSLHSRNLVPVHHKPGQWDSREHFCLIGIPSKVLTCLRTVIGASFFSSQMQKHDMVGSEQRYRVVLCL